MKNKPTASLKEALHKPANKKQTEKKVKVTKKQLKKETEQGLAEEQAMIDELKDPELLFNIIKEVHKEGVVGEEDTILVLTLKASLRLVCDAKAESSNIVVSDVSGGGKDYLVERVCRILLPKECYKHRTGLTPKVFTYWHTDKKSQKKGYTWNGQVLHLEDPNEDLLKCDGFKTMASGGSETTVVRDQKAEDYSVIGKPVIIVTSLKAKIDIEGIRRWDAVNIDTSKELNRAIIQKNILETKNTKDVEVNQSIRDGLQRLRVKCVVIPYAEQLLDIFPPTITNRTLSKTFMDYIKASAVLHQYQRDKTEYGEVIANWFDYDYARFVFCTCSTKTGVMLNKIEQEFIEILNSKGDEALSVSEIRPLFSRGKDWIYNNMGRLKELGVIGELHDWDDRSNKEVMKIYSKHLVSNTTKIRLSDAFLSISDDKNKNQQIETSKYSGCRGFLKNAIVNIKEMRLNSGLLPLSLIFSQQPRKPNNNKDSTEESGLLKKIRKLPNLTENQKTID